MLFIHFKNIAIDIYFFLVTLFIYWYVDIKYSQNIIVHTNIEGIDIVRSKCQFFNLQSVKAVVTCSFENVHTHDTQINNMACTLHMYVYSIYQALIRLDMHETGCAICMFVVDIIHMYV